MCTCYVYWIGKTNTHNIFKNCLGTRYWRICNIMCTIYIDKFICIRLG